MKNPCLHGLIAKRAITKIQRRYIIYGVWCCLPYFEAYVKLHKWLTTSSLVSPHDTWHEYIKLH